MPDCAMSTAHLLNSVIHGFTSNVIHEDLEQRFFIQEKLNNNFEQYISELDFVASKLFNLRVYILTPLLLFGIYFKFNISLRFKILYR